MPDRTDPNFAVIAVRLPLDKVFHYSIPARLRNGIEIGKRVWVEFGNRDKIGYVVGFASEAEVKNVKPVRSIIDDEPIISAEMLELCKWIKDTYLCSLGEAISATIPGVLKKGKVFVRPRSGKPGEEKLPEPRAPHELTQDQKTILENILSKAEKETHKVFLLHGVTASGKTEIYLQAVEKILAKGRTGIVLVPEIALTPQTVERFLSRFGRRVAVVHSGLLGSRRYREWKRIKNGEAKIVVGARSAIFSPVKNLGIVIIDEEHETSYKQEDTPRYHARDTAIMRARLASCPVILGSATPSLESYYLASKKTKSELVKLTKRIDDKDLPKAKVVDMRMELATRKRMVMFSRVLIDSMENALKKKQQIMIFLNRRGFSTFINCKRCGLVLKCKRCDAVLVYHYETKSLVCHYCNSRQSPPDICPKCKSGYMKYFGIGTEKVESEISRLFPGARIARMDTDTTSKRGSHGRILDEFKNHNIDILIGTQMIAKGHDFPRVTLVGIVNADVNLNLPDFRASERTFNLITQVAGRAGRGEEGGEVIIQTYAPGHYAILSASKHDYDRFYREEIKTRKDLLFPPFTHIIRLTLRSRNENATIAAANKTKDFLKKALPRKGAKAIEIIGPAPSPISRVRGYYRWNILLKAKTRSIMCEVLRKALKGYRKPGGTLLAIDVDPISV